MKPSLLHIGLCVGSESMPKYFRRQTDYSEMYLDGSLKGRLNALTKAPDYIFIQIQGDKYDGHRSTLDLIQPIKRLKDMGSFVINWTGDKRNQTPSWMTAFAHAVSITTFSNMGDVATFFNKGLEVDFLQIGIDEDIFKPEGATIEGVPEIVFQANVNNQFPLSGYRRDIVVNLQRRYGNRFGVYGNGWHNANGSTNGNQHEEAKIYRSAKIAINCSHYDSARYTSDRMFRILGSGTFCLSHDYNGIEIDFEKNKHLVSFTNTNDLFQKIDFWLDNEDQRNKIAAAGQKHCFKNFTYTNMVNKILSLKK